MANKRRRQKKCVTICLNFTYLHKCNQEKLLEIFQIFFWKNSFPQMFGYPDFDASLDISELWLFQNQCTLTLNNRNTGRGNGNNNSDCSKNDPRMPNIYVSNCSCHCPSTTVSLVQDSMSIGFLCELKNLLRLVHTFKVIWQYTWEISVLCILLFGTSFHGAK